MKVTNGQKDGGGVVGAWLWLPLFAAALSALVIGPLLLPPAPMKATNPPPAPVAADRAEQAQRADRTKARVAPTVKPKIKATVKKAKADSSPTTRPKPSTKAPKARIDLRNENLWQVVADCESGDRLATGYGRPGTANWQSNTGSFDGGLQFLPSTWRSWGGTDFAPYAHQATRAEQITVANRSGKTDPWLQPWPDCGKKAARALGINFP